MVVRKPRIADEDYLTDDELIMGGLEGEWVRCPAYEKGHRVSRDGSTAICGRPLVVLQGEWNYVRSLVAAEQNPGEWYIARDRRKNSHCAPCKGRDMFDLVDPMADTNETVVPFVQGEDKFTPYESTPADRLQQARYRSKIALVKREFSAVEATTPL